MEQDRYPAFYGEPSLPAPSPLHMFKNARDFGITGSHFTSVQGNLNIGPMLALPAIRDIFGLLENEPPGRIASITPRVPKNNPPLPAVVHSAGDSYCRQMLRQGRGFPMYVPGPQKNLPVEYRREGIAIGDVGRVTPEGGFDFFFNIYRPANDPVNVKVPEGFVPLTPYDPIDVTLYDFDSGDYVSTPSIYDVNGGFSQSTPGGKFLFNCRGPNGAVLALPHGARLEKLENLDRMRQYAAKHAESWYKYVNEVRGRELVNGSLCLITGCEKSLSWGIASFQDISLHTDFPLSFTPTAGEDDGYKYRWQGGCGRHKQADAPLVDGTPLNQTTFIHAFTISLGEGLWGKLFGKVEVSQLADSWPDTVGRGFVPFGSQASRSSRSPGLFGIGGWKGCQYSAATFQQLSISETAPISRIFHPAQIIHKHILREVPDATVVITHDDEWRDMFEDVEDNDLEMTGSRYRFDIMEEHGAVFLRSKPEQMFHLVQQQDLGFSVSFKEPTYASVNWYEEEPNDRAEDLEEPPQDHDSFLSIMLSIFVEPSALVDDPNEWNNLVWRPPTQSRSASPTSRRPRVASLQVSFRPEDPLRDSHTHTPPFHPHTPVTSLHGTHTAVPLHNPPTYGRGSSDDDAGGGGHRSDGERSDGEDGDSES